MTTKDYATGFDRIYDCPAGRRILAKTRTQPRRLKTATDGAIDWTAPHAIEPADWRPPPAACTPLRPADPHRLDRLHLPGRPRRRTPHQ